jgi:hypothetical protein
MLRHACALRYCSQCGPRQQVLAGLLGRLNIQQTVRYTELRPGGSTAFGAISNGRHRSPAGIDDAAFWGNLPRQHRVLVGIGCRRPAKTPAVVDPNLTKERLCDPGFRTSTVRHVSGHAKHQVYASYSVAANKRPCPCEIDHLISLGLGGSNAIKNLWPQPYTGTIWNARTKDDLENWLHELVCDDEITLQEAQTCIATDWITCYRQITAGSRGPR